MKIHFDGVNFNDGTGPNTFANRLARRFFESGHEVVALGPEADVSLVFIERTGQPLAKKVVQRLDGFWFKPGEFETKNVGIKALYEQADGVIWQSKFDRNMCAKHFGIRGVCERAEDATDVVISNGIVLSPVKQLTIPKLIEMRASYERIYVCSANWHRQKRLKENFELFERLRVRNPSSCLIVMGNHPDYRASGPNVFYTGPVGPDVYNQIYAAANWMLHLAWADHCPNVVVEALAQGTPVVCSDVGGTKELVGGYGLVVKDAPYDYELYDYDNPPSIDLSSIEDLPDRSSLDLTSIADIDIVSVADKYIELFERLTRQ